MPDNPRTLPLFNDTEKQVLMIMDGHAMIHRSFRAISVQRHLTVSSTGEDVTGVYGFTNVFFRAIREWNPTHCVIALDTPAPTFRHERFEQYKAQREPTPPELRPQFGRVKQLMEAFSVPIFELPGYEADDIIGTLAKKAEQSDVDVIILTGDRDTFQLISPRIRVDLASSIQDRRVYDETELETRYMGLTAAQQPDFKALLGDSSDNIPGVPKVGEKRAITLLNEYKNLESIYQHLDDIKPPSVQKSLTENKDRAFENRELMTICTTAPVDLDLTAARFGQFDRADVVDFLTELEFHSAVPRIPSTGGSVVPSGETSHVGTAENIAQSEYETIITEQQLESMMESLIEAKEFAFDTETTSLNPLLAELVGISFSHSEGKAWYVPVGHREGSQLDIEHVLSKLKPIFEDDRISKCAHNANYDLMVLSNYGINVANLGYDTMIAAHLLGKQGLGLKPLSLDMLGIEMTPISDLIGTGKKQITFDMVTIDDAVKYAAADADMTHRLRTTLEQQLQSQSVNSILNDIEIPLIPVFVDMQRSGIRLDSGILHEMSGDLNQHMHETEMELYQSIGHTVNINSPQQLSDLLFKELGLPKTKRTKTGYSTDANSLESLKGLHPVVDQILEYRQISKLKSTYVDSLPELVNPNTGRIHTTYHQTGSATGRVSSSDPNLQNIPVRTELGKQVRKAFIADDAPNNLLFAADYSQIELRVLAHLSQDDGLLQAFKRGEDIHSSTASQMFEVPINDVTSDMRRIAKVLNFGVIYGLSPHGISQQTGFTREEGSEFIKTYFSKYPGISSYLEQVKNDTRNNQYVETLLGRRRYIPEIHSSNFNVRSGAERMAINMPIQGTAADIMKIAMINVHNQLQTQNMTSKMLLQVHDELIFEVPVQEKQHLQQLVYEEMSSAMALDVTLKVEGKWGETWGEME